MTVFFFAVIYRLCLGFFLRWHCHSFLWCSLCICSHTLRLPCQIHRENTDLPHSPAGEYRNRHLHDAVGSGSKSSNNVFRYSRSLWYRYWNILGSNTR
ncbi:hypothetical protein AVEN_53193-1 [Araneus ventricosus]|uniref:Uncharacterized protein n=1 Tax=Araneus ventricosus TaxID=182803 RepID=A0A4Y2A978_ARAVE|nr:hypothetical protein AVEN_53193-1 [Araneus ventricosus]